MAENNPKVVETMKQKEPFDMDKALDTAGFAEFMAKKETNQDNPESVEADFELFNNVKVVKEGLKKLYGEQISKDFGIRLDASDMNLIDAYLEDQAINSPEGILNLKKKLDIFREIPGQIKQLEDQLGSLGEVEDLSKSKDGLLEEKDKLDRTRKYSGFGGTGKYYFAFLKSTLNGMAHLGEAIAVAVNPDHPTSQEYREYTEELREMVKDREAVKEVSGRREAVGTRKIDSLLDGVNSKIAEINGVLENIKNAEGLKTTALQMFTKARKELLEGVSEIGSLKKVIQKKAYEELETLFDNGQTLDKSEKAQRKFEHLRQTSKESELGIDIFEGNDENEIQKQIDEAIDKAVSEAIANTVNQTELTGNGGNFTKLEKALSKITSKEKIGSREGNEAKAFMVKTLEDVAGIQEATVEGKVKRIMLNRIINKLKGQK